MRRFVEQSDLFERERAGGRSPVQPDPSDRSESADGQQRDVIMPRALHIAQQVQEHKPAAVIFYSFNNWYRERWQLIAGVPFTEMRGPHGNFYFAGRGSDVLKVAGERLHGTMASVTAAVLGGAAIVRVHDVRAAVETVRVADAVKKVQNTVA